MNRHVRKRHAVIPVAAALVVGWMLLGGGVAGAEVLLESLSVDLRPEYDTRGEMLAIYQATYLNAGEEPAEADVTLWMPGGARLGETCELTGENEHLCQLPTLSPFRGPGDEEGLQVRWPMKGALEPGGRYRAYMEFYVPMDVSRPQREIAFRYPQAGQVGRLRLHLMQPAGAAEFVSEPAPVSSSSSGGAPVHYYDLQPEPGKPAQVVVRYTRPTDEPFAAALAGAAGGSRSAGGDAGGAGTGLLPSQVTSWVLGIAVLGVLAYFLAREAGGRKRRSRRGKGKGRLGRQEELRLARQALLEGRISEATYRDLCQQLKAGSGE